MSAVRIFAEIEDTFAKSIPLATLFEAGTIEKLASILEIDGWAPPESSLVPIQPNGKRPTFFCVHAKGGNVLFYKDLAARLGNDQPFYGIQARRLAGRQVGHESVEEMAAYYIKEIKSLQPKGPYYLGGSSFGGLAAFEIARQLSAAGDEIGLLALLDTGTPDYPIFLPSTTKFRSKVYEAVRRIQHHRDSLTQLEKQERFNYIKAKIGRVQLKYKRKFRNSYKKAVREFFTRFRDESAIPSKYLQLEDKIWKAGQQYAPKYYAGKVTLFIASVQPLGIVADRSLGWDRFTDRLEIHEVPGHHGSIVKEPYVSVTAKKLRACIDRTLNDRQQTNHSFEQEASRQSRYDVAGV